MALSFTIEPKFQIPDLPPQLDEELKECTLDPKEKGNFHIWARYYILTYKTHLDKTKVSDFFRHKFNAQTVRVAHETSDKTAAYDHSHVFVDLGKQTTRRDCRVFDFEGIHPNIGPIGKRKHLNRVYAYMCKQDKSNIDMLEWVDKRGVCVQDIWEYETLQDAVKHADKVTEVPGIIAAYSLKPKPEVIPKDWEFIWQVRLEIEMRFLKQNPREVRWYCDIIGGLGKTDFAKGMLMRHPRDTFVFTQFGGARDAATIIMNALSCGWTGKYCIIDLPRDAETKAIYEPMEMIRNGMITAIKYQGMTVTFDCAWMIVFANFPPDFGHMSQDRWKYHDMRRATRFSDKIVGDVPGTDEVLVGLTAEDPIEVDDLPGIEKVHDLTGTGNELLRAFEKIADAEFIKGNTQVF